MRRQPAIPRSPFLAAAVTFTALLLMLAPLRRAPQTSPPREAGWLPLMNGSVPTDSSAFHRLESSADRYQASAVPLLRQMKSGPP